MNFIPLCSIVSYLSSDLHFILSSHLFSHMLFPLVLPTCSLFHIYCLTFHAVLSRLFYRFNETVLPVMCMVKKSYTTSASAQNLFCKHRINEGL